MKNLLILLFVTYSMICIGQDESQKPFQNSIALSGGFGITNGNPIRRLGISFDRTIKNNWVLNGSVLIDGSQSSWHSGNVISNDFLIITSDWRIESSNQMIKLGAKKYLFDFFYLGADFNLGIYTRTNVSRERQLDYDSDHDEWSYSSIIDPSQTSGGIWYSYTALEINRYLNYGLSLKIGIQLPVNERCNFIFQYSPEYIWRAPFNKNLSSISILRHFAEMKLCVRI